MKDVELRIEHTMGKKPVFQLVYKDQNRSSFLTGNHWLVTDLSDKDVQDMYHFLNMYFSCAQDKRLHFVGSFLFRR